MRRSDTDESRLKENRIGGKEVFWWKSHFRENCQDDKPTPRRAVGDLVELECCPGLLFAGFLGRPESLQFGRQLRSGCRTHRLLFGFRGGFDRTRRCSDTFNLGPSCPLSSGNALFYRRAHGPLFLWRSSRIRWRTEDTAEVFVQRLDSFFNRGSPFELINCEVE